MNVILADDHSIIREGLRLLLETQPDIHVIGTATNGRDAVSQVLKLRPDIVIMDIVMPELNGIEATIKIRETDASAKVIILSMYASSEYIFRAFNAGVYGYVLKESAGAEIIQAVRAVKDGRRYLSEKISDLVIDNFMRQYGIAEKKSPIERLSQREREILQFIAEGKTSAEIASIVYLSPKTVDTYRSRIMKKLGVSDHTALIKFSIQHGITTAE
ncbi:MAG TPA: response regulator transcription factor [Syntrophorhabdaceae bacterium]|mgnify:CR=1 FL=1|nr:response regulator transcription factor [Syntrophorhabdaceae bacterium]HQM80100.1 response regulator transcription factor [Syntrophorhabdaceae bacterium]